MSIRGVLLFCVAFLTARASTYTGAAACAKCHAEIHAKWSQSRHSKMVQPATRTSVKGDFTRGKLQLRGAPYAVRERDGAYYITESTLTGKPAGASRGLHAGQSPHPALPHHALHRPRHRAARQVGMCCASSGSTTSTSPIPTRPARSWCRSGTRTVSRCHVSRQEKGYDTAKNAYQTSWQDFGTNCERCHGPGAEHVAIYSAPGRRKGRRATSCCRPGSNAARNTMVCAQCHSFRDIYALGFAAGENYYDYFLPILEATQPVDNDPAYWPDGRTRRFSNDAFGFWQSECYLKGKASPALDCHTAAARTPTSNAIRSCGPSQRPVHPLPRSRRARRSPPTRTTPQRAPGSSCVECHMPRTVQSIKAEIRDHSMSVPAPENTLRHAIPNACNLCHKDRDAQWSLDKMNAWYGDGVAAEVDSPRRRVRGCRQGRCRSGPEIDRDSECAGRGSAGAGECPERTWRDFRAMRGCFRRCRARWRTNSRWYARWRRCAWLPRPADKAEAVRSLAAALGDPVTTVESRRRRVAGELGREATARRGRRTVRTGEAGVPGEGGVQLRRRRTADGRGAILFADRRSGARLDGTAGQPADRSRSRPHDTCWRRRMCSRARWRRPKKYC